MIEEFFPSSGDPEARRTEQDEQLLSRQRQLQDEAQQVVERM